MQEYEQAVFLSYAWGGDREEIINPIYEALLKHGIQNIRDKRTLRYKGSTTGFVQQLWQVNCVGASFRSDPDF